MFHRNVKHLEGWGGGQNSMMECLPSTWEALGLNPAWKGKRHILKWPAPIVGTATTLWVKSQHNSFIGVSCIFSECAPGDSPTTSWQTQSTISLQSDPMSEVPQSHHHSLYMQRKTTSGSGSVTCKYNSHWITFTLVWLPQNGTVSLCQIQWDSHSESTPKLFMD
jgi:hypothetical protein